MGLSFTERLSSFLSTLQWDIMGAVATALATIFALIAIIVSAHYSKEAAVAQKRSIDISLLDKRNDIVAFLNKKFGESQELLSLKSISESVRILFSDDVFEEFSTYLTFLVMLDSHKKDCSNLFNKLSMEKSDHRDIDRYINENIILNDSRKWVLELHKYMSRNPEKTIEQFGVAMTFYDNMEQYVKLKDYEDKLEREHQSKHLSLVSEIKDEIYHTIKN